LASISHVSRLTISSRTAVNPCGFKATYSEGKLTKDGIKACAMPDKGTQINVEDLFYNSSIRKNSLRNGSEEFSKIYDVVSKYAIHNYHVSFILKRSGENSMDLKTSGCLIAKGEGKCTENENFLLDNISAVHGSELRRELERVHIDYDDKLQFKMNGYMSNSKYSQLKQMIFILFINDRLVDCQPIKKTLQSVFNLYMPKNTNCFVYMNLQINPLNLDVNIHPTKHEVRFLYQDEIIIKIQTCFEQKLLNSDSSRSFYVKSLTLEPFISSSSTSKKKASNEDDEDKAEDASSDAKKSTTTTPIIYPYQLTRMDSKERKIDSYLHQTSLNESIRGFKENLNEEKKKKCENSTIASDEVEAEKEKDNDVLTSNLRYQKLSREFNFKSLKDLRNSIEKMASKSITKILRDMNFVGCLDRELALIQHKTGLYISNTRSLTEELFYQIGLFNFGNFGCNFLSSNYSALSVFNP
jgi:DNA mismatch repair protein MLH1